MTASSTRKLTGIKYAATILGAFAVLAVAPATAFAVDNEPTPGGGCTYTDADGYPIPIDDGQDVFVDGKIVSCRGGTITVTTAPQSGGIFQPTGPKGGVFQPPVADNGGVLEPTTPKSGGVLRPPVLGRGPVLAQP
ncbi:hypothetical protein [Mycolicibacterium parafortuitum]|uniref:Uncharacterized protein n=1 Tax=Mycolicibacterium parafortuitum TaxID=39692 RepID=A0A375YGA6_MYCPF|nr:hypothetical protein [Mycolicibacterium parafortuitum]ORB28008.1 hypothetical protein BST38_21885 [Mycolicibacterium parafortuitum]SRX80099.1 hypothetical protein MPP7335_01838 [Mycolicibacterium parafortuitum]